MYKTADKIPSSQLRLVRLEASHNISDFDCIIEKDDGDADEFLKTTALDYQNNGMATTYLCMYKDEIVGFVTLCNNSVDFSWSQVEKLDDSIRHTEIPALKIAWIGTHKDYRNRDIGSYMIYSAVEVALKLAYKIGVRLITLDTREALIPYYENRGFKIINKETKEKEHPVMYFDLSKSNII